MKSWLPMIATLATTVLAPAASSAEKPNVLFIPVDDLNHWVGYTGRNPQIKTPNIDRLSKLGVSFTNAHCAAPACEPSRAALMSGMRPSTSGCYKNGDGWKKFIPEGSTLNATFKQAGWFVAGMGKTYHGAGPKSVYQSEWNEYPQLRTNSGGGAEKYQGYLKPLPLDLKDADLGDWHTIDYIAEQLGRKRDKPFFLSCGLIKPHLPWAVPRKYYDIYPRDSIRLPPHQDDDFDDIPEAGKKTGIRTDHPQFLDNGRWKDAIQSYLATITYVDVCIGRLLDAYENSPQRDNTIIVLWGDHGWHLGEKQRWRKFTLWEEATRAPMIWVVPGLAKGGSLCAAPVDFMSIYPTLCDLAGIEKPKHVEGRSLRPLLKNPDADWDGVAITTHGFRNHAVRSDRFRYIRYQNGDEELYDHDKDPYEWKNLAKDPEFAAAKAKLAARLPARNVPAKTPAGPAKAKKTKRGKKAKTQS